MLKRLRLSFSHFREHKFKHGFKGTLNPRCSCILKLKPQHSAFCAATSLIQTNKPLRMTWGKKIISFSTVSDTNLT